MLIRTTDCEGPPKLWAVQPAIGGSSQKSAAGTPPQSTFHMAHTGRSLHPNSNVLPRLLVDQTATLQSVHNGNVAIDAMYSNPPQLANTHASKSSVDCLTDVNNCDISHLPQSPFFHSTDQSGLPPSRPAARPNHLDGNLRA